VPRFASLNLPPQVETPRAGARPAHRRAHRIRQDDDAGGAGEQVNLREYIITIEDPINEHPHRRSLVEQVEIGIDAPDFPTALRPPSARRPTSSSSVRCAIRSDAIAVAAGEPGTWSSTFHDRRRDGVARIADSFPGAAEHVRQEVAMSLAAVLTQTLMPKIGGGRIPAAGAADDRYGARQQVRGTRSSTCTRRSPSPASPGRSPSRNR
jgi:twitching motility protein PilT